MVVLDFEDKIKQIDQEIENEEREILYLESEMEEWEKMINEKSLQEKINDAQEEIDNKRDIIIPKLYKKKEDLLNREDETMSLYNDFTI